MSSVIIFARPREKKTHTKNSWQQLMNNYYCFVSDELRRNAEEVYKMYGTDNASCVFDVRNIVWLRKWATKWNDGKKATTPIDRKLEVLNVRDSI